MDDFEDDDDDLLLTAVDLNLSNDQGPSGVEKGAADVPVEFPFPFEAYDIQKGFMNELYKCLNNSQIGIFESPTGTGKSLSLICGALKWLKDFKEKQQKELDALMSDKESSEKSSNISTTGNNEFNWITEFTINKEREDKLKKFKEEQDLIAKREAKLKELSRGAGTHQGKRKRVKIEDEFDDLMKDASVDLKEAFDAEMKTLQRECGMTDDKFEDTNLMLDDYISEDENESRQKEGDLDEEEHVTKIYFCSRTHSQLSQFVREVVKSPYGDDTRVISLGSRQNLCVNEAVKQLKSLSLINETCLDLQKKGKKSNAEEQSKKRAKLAACPYYKYDVLQDLKDAILLEVRDIEQLVTLGKQMKACPYYSSRYAIPAAQIVALPYNTLLHKSTRDACGIKLKDNVVIIDEAHNLLETINNIYSVEVSGAQALRAHNQLSQYERKYKSRLKAKNLMYVKQILYILAAIVKCLGGKLDENGEKQTGKKSETQLKTINDFLFISQLDNLNLFKVLRYCGRSQISRKLHSFVEKYPESEINDVSVKNENCLDGVTKFLQELNSTQPTPDLPLPVKRHVNEVSMSSPLMHIESFLQALTNADADGRILITKQALFSQSSVKFLLLNPAIHFSSVIKECRSVIVAGGTMQPISEFTDQLFQSAGVGPSQVMTYSCGHVIPHDHILPLVISSGPSGVDMDFTFQSRESPTLIDELGRIIVNICNVVPGGVVCFFPSYDYENLVYNHWQKYGFIDRFSKKKKVFREPRKSGGVEVILADYTSTIKRCKTIGSGTYTGAILFSVVGGKMSEGINFSDELGRCVVMIGLPYPNLRSPELKEKMDYLNANYPKDSEGRLPGQVHYDNLCMKAVNQSIGRAIRHRGDYASILLIDKRYNRNSVISKLPNWISQHVQKHLKFGLVVGAISKFFQEKKEVLP